VAAAAARINSAPKRARAQSRDRLSFTRGLLSVVLRDRFPSVRLTGCFVRSLARP
jgi:hypothetical protein